MAPRPRRHDDPVEYPLKNRRDDHGETTFQPMQVQKVHTTDKPLVVAPTRLLPLLVFLDMLGVSLVVPLLFQYFLAAGVTSAGQRELLSSVFSASQIVGGLALGALSDAGVLQRRTILLLSFGGSAMAYALLLYKGPYPLVALVASRILVGLVKQTMTITTTLLTNCTTDHTRAKYMGQLTASSTMAWIAGPSLGALLFRYVDPSAPILLACGLFVINMGLVALFLPNEECRQSTKEPSPPSSSSSLVSNLSVCFHSRELGSIVASLLIITWVSKATSYATMGSYYEDMYGLEPHQRGYISSYQQSLRFVVQSSLVGWILRWSGGERRAACWSAALLALATLLETRQSLIFFLTVLSPAISLSLAMMQLSLKTLVTQVVPTNSMYSVLAALDLLQNAAMVTIPFYRTVLFSWLGGSAQSSAMSGDPSPMVWVISSAIHWILVTAVLSYLLLQDWNVRSSWKQR